MSLVYGDQIPNDDQAALQDDDRPIVNRNIVLPKVLQYLGSSLKRQRSIAAFPVDSNGDDAIAAKITKLFKHTEQDNDMDYIDLQVRGSAAINKVGWYYIPPPAPDAEGDDLLVKVYFEPPENVLLDADARDLDQKTWRRVGHRSWMSVEDIMGLWSEYADEIRDKVKDGDKNWNTLTERIRQGVRPASTIERGATSSTLILKNADVYDKVNQLFLVLCLWERNYRWGANGKREAYMLLRIAIPYLNFGLGRYELPLKYYPFVLNQSLNFGSTVIDTASYVDQLRPLQEEKNRVSAMAEDAMSRAVAETLILGKGEETLKEAIKKNGSKPGIYTAATDNPVADRINSAGISVGVQEYIAKLDVDIEKISVLPPAVGGAAENKSESGSYFAQKVDQGEQSIEIFSFIENRKVKKLLYRVILERYQVYYTAPMALRIFGEQPIQPGVPIQNQPKYADVAINQIDWATGSILDDITVGRYDVVIDDVNYSNSVRSEELRVLVDALKVVPPQVAALLIPEFIKNLPLERRLEFSAMAEQVLAPFIMQAMNPIPPAEEGAVGNRRTIQSPQPAI